MLSAVIKMARVNAACAVFKKYYADLSIGLQSHLTTVVVHLYSAGLVSVDSRNKILDTNGLSQMEKCVSLLNDIEEQTKRDSSVFENFCRVLCHQTVGLSDYGEQMNCDFHKRCEELSKPIRQASTSVIQRSNDGETREQFVPTDESTIVMHGLTDAHSELLYYDESKESGSTQLQRTQTAIEDLSQESTDIPEQVKKLKKEKQDLIGALDIQSEDKHRRIKEAQNEIQQLQAEVAKQRKSLRAREKLLEKKKKEQQTLKGTLNSREKELHRISHYARYCPIYNDKRKLIEFEQKNGLHTQT